jgi:hypothetical protein
LQDKDGKEGEKEELPCIRLLISLFRGQVVRGEVPDRRKEKVMKKKGKGFEGKVNLYRHIRSFQTSRAAFYVSVDFFSLRISNLEYNNFP